MALDAILRLARAEPDREICGLLFGTADAITGFTPARNVAPDPERRFEIDPATLVAAHRAERGGGVRIMGCYHSHPSGAPWPSARDAADAAPNGWLWLIVGVDDARFWRAVEGGGRHGRFDPVPFTCVPAPESPENALSSEDRA